MEKIPGLNTLSVSLARIDYAPGGLNPPHTHPRTTEGELEVGFITTKNNGKSPASVLSAFNSQLPGTVSVAAMLFAAEPALPEDVLTKTFQLGSKMVDKIKDMLATKKSFK
ncbi:germin-like protein subfamily 2 member 2 [Brassica napus]|uniref:germin-like protein subfamily 2 member 2 n=1 Tax=Brassica napus TaxID=3708 RepID=UPI00207863FD|nr:germin-like protein subfamily 2 member 2 [Brassica napus]